MKMLYSLPSPSIFKRRFQRDPSRQEELKKQTQYRTKYPEAAREGSVCSLCNVGLPWTLGTFHSLIFWLIITICVVAGSQPFAGLSWPACGLADQPEGYSSCSPLVFLRNSRCAHQLLNQPMGEWLALLSASWAFECGFLV